MCMYTWMLLHFFIRLLLTQDKWFGLCWGVLHWRDWLVLLAQQFWQYFQKLWWAPVLNDVCTQPHTHTHKCSQATCMTWRPTRHTNAVSIAPAHLCVDLLCSSDPVWAAVGQQLACSNGWLRSCHGEFCSSSVLHCVHTYCRGMCVCDCMSVHWDAGEVMPIWE